MTIDTSARVSVLSTWVRSMLDPYVRAESASLTVQLSQLAAFAAVAPARQDAVILDAQTKGVSKVGEFGIVCEDADHDRMPSAPQ